MSVRERIGVEESPEESRGERGGGMIQVSACVAAHLEVWRNEAESQGLRPGTKELPWR
jgi:hypothetical protein